MFLSAGCSLLRAEGLFGSLKFLYGGLGKGKLLFVIQKNVFSAVNFVTFFFLQNPGSGSGLDPDPDRYPIQPKMLDPDLYQMSTDPKICFFAKRRHILASINTGL